VAPAETPSIIADSPTKEGLSLREALARYCPFWEEHIRLERNRIHRLRSGDIEAAGLSYVERVAWARVIAWLRDQVRNKVWVLEAYPKERMFGDPVRFPPEASPHLSVGTDHETIAVGEAQFFGGRIYAPATMAPEQAAPVRVVNWPTPTDKAKPQSKIPMIELLQEAIVEIPFPERTPKG
jgi:hypothetical protein